MSVKIGMAASHPGEIVGEFIDDVHLMIAPAARVIGVRRTTLSDLVQGKTPLSSPMALRIEKAFGMSMDTLCACTRGTTLLCSDSGLTRSMFSATWRPRGNLIGALCRALNDHPDGCIEAGGLAWGRSLLRAPRDLQLFNEAVDMMVYAGLVLRAGGRLHAGLNRTDAARAGRRSQLLRTLLHRPGA